MLGILTKGTVSVTMPRHGVSAHQSRWMDAIEWRHVNLSCDFERPRSMMMMMLRR